MFKQIIDPVNALFDNRFTTIQTVYSDITKYQPSAYFLYETGSTDITAIIQNAFDTAQDECTAANDFYLANEIVTNFKIVGYQFGNQQSGSGKMYFYFVIQDFAGAINTPILY